jgi:hypothetical protein
MPRLLMLPLGLAAVLFAVGPEEIGHAHFRHWPTREAR